MPSTDLNPADAIIDEAIYWRGMFIHRYAAVEYALADLLVRARWVAAYKHLGDLPFTHKERLKRAREIASMDGPWKVWAADLTGYLNRFESLEEVRHFFAHGILGQNPNAKDPMSLVVRMYGLKGKPAEVQDGFFLLTLSEIREYATSVQPIVSGFLGLCAEIGRKFPKVSNAIPSTAE